MLLTISHHKFRFTFVQSLRILFTLFSICFVFCLNAQDARLEGTVLGPDNKPQQGVSVVVEEIPSIGTATDAQGKFTLQVPAGKKITILFSKARKIAKELDEGTYI